ncbi:hypothetical protein DBR11_24915 [Pedobacter sp. HMWF019]|uniref:DNA-formamidopyrimidine glycosylase family protein n=1 Tax=Pedobacter sp. HMWF019 TaxID=2056856 RepID=UPI000D38CB65|nr:DNA-formamidopyrimidine glycosylase family protein [Pedobacter sp. HMWF019]PTS93588.1 hypothetical protein DBR11_24915 [Pedobacter sp. HMWF019]
MLELPYLEIFAENFDKKFRNRVLQKVEVNYKKCINVSIADLKESLEGQELKKVFRRGLTLCFQFKNHTVLEMCVRSKAELVVLEGEEAYRGLINLYFSGGQVLSVKDPLKRSAFFLNPIQTAIPDVLSKEMTVEYLKSIFLNNTKQIRDVLTDQEVIGGVDEAYADEILWYAEISPFSIAGSIPLEEVKVLLRTMKYVLLDAIKQIKRIDFGKIGYANPDLLMIHHVDKKKSPTGYDIQVKTVAGAKVYYTDEQKPYI